MVPDNTTGDAELVPASMLRVERAASQGVALYPARVEAEESTLGILDYVALLWKFKRTFLVLSLTGLVGALVFSFNQKPTYRAALQLEVQDLNQNFLNLRDVDPAAGASPGAPDSFVQVQVQVLQSEALLERVIQRLGLDHRPDYIAQSQTPVQRIGAKIGIERMLASLPEPRYAEIVRQALNLPPPDLDSPRTRALRVAASNLKVKAASQSSLVELLYTAPDRQTPPEFLNTLAAEFVAHTMEVRWAGTERTAEWLNTRLRDMRESLEHSERKLQAYARASGMVYTSDRESVGEEKLRQVQTEYSKAQAERATLQAMHERIVASPPQQLPQVLDHPLLRDYYTRLADLQRDLSQLTVTMKPEHQKVREVESQIASLNRLIRAEVDKVLGRIRNDYEAASRREALLGSSFQQQLHAVSEQAARSVPYVILKREVESKRQFYQDMLQKVNSAGVATAIRASNIRVVNPAQEPMLPYRPDLALNTVIGSASGLLLAIVVCFLGEAMERRNRKRWRPGQTAQYLKLPELGVIPSVRLTGGWLAKKRSIGSLLSPGGVPEHSHVALWKQRPSLLIASFHGALDFLLFAKRAEAPPRVVVITSALPLEGKTTIASYLALALADIGKRVLLIDADLRSPRLHEQFGTGNASGLSNLLESEASPETVGLNGSVVQTPIQGIDLMPSGPARRAVARLLASDKLGELLAGLREKYDTILIDTPPVLLFPDARVIGRHSDGVVLVVRSNQTPLATHQQAAQLCESSGNHVLGAILNDWKPAAKLGYSRYYKKYAGT